MQRRTFLSGILAFSVIPRAHAASFVFPDILVDTEGGKEERLSTVLQAYYSKPVLVHAWASYCPPCIADMPLLQELEKSLPSLGLYLIRPSSQEDRDTVLKIQEKGKYFGRNVLLQVSSQKNFFDSYQGQRGNKFVIPTYFLLSKEGQCVSIEEGTLGNKDRLKRINKTIEELLK